MNRFCRGIFVTLLTLCFLGSAAWGREQIVTVAEFQSVHGSLTISNLIRSDNGRRGQLYLRFEKLGSPLWFTKPQWATFRDSCSQAMQISRKLPQGQACVLTKFETVGGSDVRIDALRHTPKPAIRIIRVPRKGDSYPAVPFVVDASDFSSLQEALDKVWQHLSQ